MTPVEVPVTVLTLRVAVGAVGVVMLLVVAGVVVRRAVGRAGPPRGRVWALVAAVLAGGLLVTAALLLGR